MVAPFFWLHVKKAGGTTVRAMLGEHYVQTNRSIPTPFVALPKLEWNDALNNHRLPLGEYDFRRTLFAKRFLYGAEFETMYKFAVVRNPYDRLVSAYLYVTKRSRKWKMFRLLGKQRAFYEFVSRLSDKWAQPNKLGNRHVATHTAPVIPDVSDEKGRLLLDDLIPLEQLSERINGLEEQLGIPLGDIPRGNQGRLRSEYRSYYSSKCRSLVEKLYKLDIERLGYDY